MNSPKNYELLYHYEQMSNDTNLTVRIPKELKEDFINIAGNKAYTKIVRELLVMYISQRQSEI